MFGRPRGWPLRFEFGAELVGLSCLTSPRDLDKLQPPPPTLSGGDTSPASCSPSAELAARSHSSGAHLAAGDGRELAAQASRVRELSQLRDNWTAGGAQFARQKLINASGQANGRAKDARPVVLAAR